MQDLIPLFFFKALSKTTVFARALLTSLMYAFVQLFIWMGNIYLLSQGSKENLPFIFKLPWDLMPVQPRGILVWFSCQKTVLSKVRARILRSCEKQQPIIIGLSTPWPFCYPFFFSLSFFFFLSGKLCSDLANRTIHLQARWWRCLFPCKQGFWERIWPFILCLGFFF